jgi:hypothetical protein
MDLLCALPIHYDGARENPYMLRCLLPAKSGAASAPAQHAADQVEMKMRVKQLSIFPTATLLSAILEEPKND